MSKINWCDGARVVIDVSGYCLPKDGDPKRFMTCAKDLAKQATRHLKDDDYCGNIDWEFVNPRDICSHCKLDWEVEENGQPVCCNAAVVEWQEQQVTA